MLAAGKILTDTRLRSASNFSALIGLFVSPPVDVGLAARLFDEELVFGRAAAMFARIDDDLTIGSEAALAVAHGVFHQLRHRKIPVHGCNAVEADRFEVIGKLLRGIR